MPSFLLSLKTPIPTISGCEASYLHTRPFDRGIPNRKVARASYSILLVLIKTLVRLVFFQSAGYPALLIAYFTRIFVLLPAFNSISFDPWSQGFSRNAQGEPAPRGFLFNLISTKTITQGQARKSHGRNPWMDNKMN